MSLFELLGGFIHLETLSDFFLNSHPHEQVGGQVPKRLQALVVRVDGFIQLSGPRFVNRVVAEVDDLDIIVGFDHLFDHSAGLVAEEVVAQNEFFEDGVVGQHGDEGGSLDVGDVVVGEVEFEEVLVGAEGVRDGLELLG